MRVSREYSRQVLQIVVLTSILTAGVGIGVPAFAASSSPSQLSLTVAPPSSVQSGSVLEPQPVIEIQDSDGNTDMSADGSVTAAIQPDVQGTMLMNATAMVIDGVASFSNLTIDALSGTYTLVFTYDNLSISSGPIVVTSGVCAGCVIFVPVRSYSPTFGPFTKGSSHLNRAVLLQLRRLAKWIRRNMGPGFSGSAKLTVRVFGYSGIEEASQPETLALERADAVREWIEPRIRDLDHTSMPVRYLVSREVIRSNSAISHKVMVVLKLSTE